MGAAEIGIRETAFGDPVLAVMREAFGGEGEGVARLWADLERTEALRGSLVAVIAGEVVGHVGLSHAWLDTRRALVDVWLLSPLAVAPAHQGRGLGGRLVAAAIEAARAALAPLVFVEGDPDYYGIQGFEPALQHGFTPASARTPGPAFQVVRCAGHEDWMTGQVIYRDVWWRHDAAGLRDPLLAEMEERYR